MEFPANQSFGTVSVNEACVGGDGESLAPCPHGVDVARIVRVNVGRLHHSFGLVSNKGEVRGDTPVAALPWYADPCRLTGVALEVRMCRAEIGTHDARLVADAVEGEDVLVELGVQGDKVRAAEPLSAHVAYTCAIALMARPQEVAHREGTKLRHPTHSRPYPPSDDKMTTLRWSFERR